MNPKYDIPDWIDLNWIKYKFSLTTKSIRELEKEVRRKYRSIDLEETCRFYKKKFNLESSIDEEFKRWILIILIEDDHFKYFDDFGNLIRR